MEIPNQSNDFCFDFVTFNHFAQKKPFPFIFTECKEKRAKLMLIQVDKKKWTKDAKKT